ncbi:agmatinase [Halobacteriales archaeon SW_7_68_16]|nr:MAG: agmatinase [Halobacteriales archaeon SW_7_68_16]
MRSFPGATADRDVARYAVVGAPLDASTSFRPGARFGPDRIRELARGFEDYDRPTGTQFSHLGVHDTGDLRPWDDVAAYLDLLADDLAALADDGVVPLLVGGEHTVTLAGVRAVAPEVVVIADAHLDLRASFDGNPLSHATVTRRALAVADRAIVLGARAGSEAEWERAGADDVTAVPPAAVSDWDPPDARCYLSVDIDAADPGVAPGTGTPEPFGLASRTLRDVVRATAPLSVGFDVVEVNDRDDGQAAVLAAKLLRAFVHAHADAEGAPDPAVDEAPLPLDVDAV